MPTLDWLDRQTAFSVANNIATHVLRPHTAGSNAHGIFGDTAAARDNLLIQGDNLQALKALLPFYREQVKLTVFTQYCHDPNQVHESPKH